MTDEEYQKRVKLIQDAYDSGAKELSRQLSWDLWEALEEPRFQYPLKEK
jgi:hypothetical protein